MYLRFAILGIVNYMPMTGYDLNKLFLSSANYFWHAQMSQIYKELNTLCELGYVSFTEEAQSGKPDKKVYYVTAVGKKALTEWLETDHNLQMFQIKSPLLIKIMLGANMSHEAMINMLHEQKKLCEEALQGIVDIQKDIPEYEQMIHDSSYRMYWQMASDYGKKYYQMNIAWIDESIKRLEMEE